MSFDSVAMNNPSEIYAKMTAKKELLKVIKRKARIKCAIILSGPECKKQKIYILKVNHSDVDLRNFLNNLDFEYDNDYGSQELFGTVWLHDGIWLERGEYDGSEWWAYKKIPKIPKVLERVIEDNK